MNFADLEKIIIDTCHQHHFSTDIRDIFISIKAHQNVMNAMVSLTSKFQNVDNDLLYDLIAMSYQKHQRFFYPVIKCKLNEKILDQNQPRLCLGLHSNFSPLTALLLKRNIDFVIVSDYPEILKINVFASGVRNADIKIISSDETCLLNTKKHLQKNHLVSSTIDFQKNLHGQYDSLSDSMLKFARVMQTATFFGVSAVNDMGELTYTTIEVDIDSDIETIKESLLRFISKYKAKAHYEFDKFIYRKRLDAVN